MKYDFTTTVHKWLPIVLILLSLLLMLLPSVWVVLFRDTLLTLVSPIDRVVAGSLQALGRVPRAMVSASESERQITRLSNEVTELESERDAALAKAAELQRTLDSLYEAADTIGDAPLVPLPVEIVGKPARVLAARQGLRGTLLIRAGRISGVKQGDAVVFARYVVGRVISTGLDTSQVQLVTDPGFRAAVMACAPDNAGGIHAEGTIHGEGGGQCVMKHVLRTDPVAVDDVVLTSGFAGLFPRGFIVGRVSRVTSMYDAGFQRVEVTPAVKFEQLETVLVLMKRTPSTP